jgi:hypothetical protein
VRPPIISNSACFSGPFAPLVKKSVSLISVTFPPEGGLASRSQIGRHRSIHGHSDAGQHGWLKIGGCRQGALVGLSILLFSSYLSSPIGAKLELSREVRVASILPFIKKTGTAFDDFATKAMGEAFDAACKELHDSGQPQIVYEVIAKRIIDAAKRGERDIARLRDAGLAALGLRNEPSA